MDCVTSLLFIMVLQQRRHTPVNNMAFWTQIIIQTSNGTITLLGSTGTIDDSNTSFIFISQPSLIVINGASYQPTGGAITWSWNSLTLTATLSSPVGLNGSIYGIK